MRTNPDDLAADLAELDQRFATIQKSIAEVAHKLAVLKDAEQRVYRLRCGMEALSEMRRQVDSIETMAEEAGKMAAGVPIAGAMELANDDEYYLRGGK